MLSPANLKWTRTIGESRVRSWTNKPTTVPLPNYGCPWVSHERIWITWNVENPGSGLINKGPCEIPSRISSTVGRLYVNTQNPSEGTPAVSRHVRDINLASVTYIRSDYVPQYIAVGPPNVAQRIWDTIIHWSVSSPHKRGTNIIKITLTRSILAPGATTKNQFSPVLSGFVLSAKLRCFRHRSEVNAPNLHAKELSELSLGIGRRVGTLIRSYVPM